MRRGFWRAGTSRGFNAIFAGLLVIGELAAREPTLQHVEPAGDICAITPSVFDSNLDSFHMVYLTTSIRQLPQGRKTAP